MAKSKNGGSRAFIRGRIGSDVYSVGKNGQGARQQVVRSLAVQVSNPRTQSQMFGRMIMSTVMQAVSALSPVIDHSFDNIAKGQPSISEFIRRNYQLVKADAIAHPASGNSFGLNKFQEKGTRSGAYVVSDGQLVLPTTVYFDAMDLQITPGASGLTVNGIIEGMGISRDGYLTWLGLVPGGGMNFARVTVDPSLAGSTVINAENVASAFLVESNCQVEIELSNGKVSLAFQSETQAHHSGVIMSSNVDGGWKHNTCVLYAESSPTWTADDALPTYPTGTAQFLNGGDL